MSGFNSNQQRMRMMYQQNPGQQQANPQGQQPQQQYGGNMNRMPGGQNMVPGGGQMMPNQGVQGGMRPMGSMGMRPQNMPPQQQQQQMMQQQQQQQIIMQQQQTQAQPPMVQQPQAPPTQQQPTPSPQQPMSNQSQNPLTPMGYGEGGPNPNSPSVAPQTPGNSAPDQQQQQQQPATPNTPQQPPQQQKEINTAMVCRIGQESVQDIISRTHEVFSYLRVLQPPYGSAVADKNFHDKQIRMQEVLGGITTLFKRLRVCWEKANEHTAGMEYTALESLIPYKEDQTMKNEIDKKRGEPYKSALEEHNELIQQLVLKNKHIKEIIDQMRNIIWEINTMLAMR